MSAPSLYTLAQGFLALTDLLEQLDAQHGTVDGDAAVVAKWLAELDGQVNAKLESTGQYLRMVELAAEAAHAEAERLRERAASCERKAARIKAAVLQLLDAAQLKRLETKTFSFTVAGDGGMPPLVIDDVDPNEVAAALPDLVVTTVALNKPAIREVLERGGTLPFARLGQRGRHLRIR
jgi:hypothetical protein